MPVKLKTIYEKEDEIPDGFGDLYAERGGKFELVGVEGVKTQADIDRVQEALRKEKNDHKVAKDRLQAFGDTDPATLPQLNEELAEARARLDTLTSEGKVDEAKVEERINAAINRAVGPLNRDKESLNRQLETAKKTVADKEAEIATVKQEQQQERIRLQIRDAVTGGKMPVLPTAVDDAVLVGESQFEFVDGKLVTKDANGLTPGLTPAEWAKDMQERKPHWWPQSQGGGAQGGRGGSLTMKENPWSVEGWSITKQGQVYKENPEKAAQMAERAGSKIGAVRPTKAA